MTLSLSYAMTDFKLSHSTKHDGPIALTFDPIVTFVIASLLKDCAVYDDTALSCMALSVTCITHVFGLEYVHDILCIVFSASAVYRMLSLM